MRTRPKFVSSSLSASERRVYLTVTMVFIGAFFAFQWPIYLWFSRVRPLVFGLPLSLFYLLALLAACFFSLLALYLWEARSGRLEEPPAFAGAPQASTPARRTESDRG